MAETFRFPKMAHSRQETGDRGQETRDRRQGKAIGAIVWTVRRFQSQLTFQRQKNLFFGDNRMFLFVLVLAPIPSTALQSQFGVAGWKFCHPGDFQCQGTESCQTSPGKVACWHPGAGCRSPGSAFRGLLLQNRREW